MANNAHLRRCKTPTVNGVCNAPIFPYPHAQTGFCAECYYDGIVEDYQRFIALVNKGYTIKQAAQFAGFIKLDSL